MILQGNKKAASFVFQSEAAFCGLLRKDKFVGGIIGPLSGVKSPQGMEWLLHIQAEYLWNAWSPFPSTAHIVKRWQWAASGVQRSKAHLSLQTRLISELAFNMDVRTSTGCYGYCFCGIFDRTYWAA